MDENIKQGKDDKKRARSVEGARLDAAVEVRQTMKSAAKPVLAKAGGGWARRGGSWHGERWGDRGKNTGPER